MPDIRAELPKAPNVEYKEKQFRFNGQWFPDRDPAVIGAENYSVLQNMRYNDGGLEGIHGYTKINTTTAIGTYVNIKNGFQLKTNYTLDSYTFVHAVSAGGQGRIYLNLTDIPDQGDFMDADPPGAATDGIWWDGANQEEFFEDVSSGLQGRFSGAPGGNMAYCNKEESVIYAGHETRIGAVFTNESNAAAGTPGDGDSPKDYTIRTNNTLQENTVDYFTYDESDQTNMWVFTTRPIQGLKIYIKTANAVAGELAGFYWSGSAWTELTAGGMNYNDGTASGGKPLAQTGWITWDLQGVDTEEPKHYQELYMYAYCFVLESPGVNASAAIYHMTADAPMQDMVDLWDGVYRQPIQCQFYYDDDNANEDYTLHVNESSDINTPIGLILDAMDAADKLYIMFEDQMVGIKFTMLSGLVNKANRLATLKYWDGDSFEAVTDFVDGTCRAGIESFNKTGTMTWTKPSDEQPQLDFGTYGYMYEITVDGALTDTQAGRGSGNEDVVVDLITGVPAQKVLPAFTFPVQYKNRLMLADYSAAKESNRMDYCVTNAPDAWNGLDSSDNGLYSLYFGGNEPITAATQLYNRFGSNIFATLVVLKDHESYLLVGDNADDFRIYPVSFNIGCPAPLTLATAEVNIAQGQGQEIQRNVAIWLSASGPVMFDGGMLSPIDGIGNYFDPNDTDYINVDAYSEARGWYDTIYKEYNLLIPTGGNATANTWLVYDLTRKKWFKKDAGTATLPLCGFSVTDDTGGKYVYAGLSNGRMMRLENGTSWDGVGITQKVKTGDFWPSDNIWDETLLRHIKIIAKRIQESHNLYVNYYGNTAQTSGVGVSFVDSDDNGCYFSDGDSSTLDTAWAGVPSSTLDLSVATGLQRLTYQNKTLSRQGWAHAFEWEVTTSDTTKGFQPVAWGIRYYVVRKDDTES
jgi:hypothetical protein